MAETHYDPVGSFVVQRVHLVDQYVRTQPHYRFTATSLPGHLIQMMTRGRTTHEVSGRRYELRPGSVIWYHEDELVRGVVHQWPWRFYTLNFIAPALEPPPYEQRVRQGNHQVLRQFQALLDAWREVGMAPLRRELRVQSALADLLAILWQPGVAPYKTDESARLWWDLETRLRQNLSRPASLADMQRLTGRSQATIARACLRAVGAPPLRRMKQVRMSFARGLVRNSDLRIKEIAARCGYGRIHEFSRDYRRHFGVPPTHDRA